MASWSDEVKQGVNTVVTESRITLDTGFFCKNVVVLPFEVADNLSKTVTMRQQTTTLPRTPSELAWPHCRFDHRNLGYQRL